jgi:long-chain acyl-CoA synthetase
MPDPGTLHSALLLSADRSSSHAAIIDGPLTLRYSQLVDAVDGAADRLVRAGVSPGASVGLLLPNGADFAIWFFAITRLAAVAVPLSDALRTRELAAHLAQVGVSALVTNRALSESAVAACAAADQPSLPVLMAGHEPLEGRCTADSPSAEHAALALRSSGSTGVPKLVIRTHRNLLFETERVVEALGLGPGDRVLGVTPFSHVNGLMRSLVASVIAGATLVTRARFERSGVARVIEQHRISVFVGVPFMFEMLADARWPTPVDLSSLRICISASAPLKPAVSRRFYDRYGCRVLQLYGTTETGSIAVNLGADAADVLESVGRPLPGIDVRIFGENGDTLPPRMHGTIGIRSPAAATEYRGSTEATHAFRDGWFFPGDVGYADESGRIYLTGRTSLFINRGGFKVNPQEIESVLEEHPLVREAAVVGVETAAGDQRVRAYVVVDAPCAEAAIIEFCRQRLADYKLPSLIEFRDSLPRSPTGKLLRSKL